MAARADRVDPSKRYPCFIKPPLRQRCDGPVHLFVCLLVSLPVCRKNVKMQKRDFLKKNKQVRAMEFIYDQVL